MIAQKLIFYTLFIVLISSCTNSGDKPLSINTSNKTETVSEVKHRELSQDFKDYWYAGKAEITSYKLVQERYGELREGTAVTVYVTEDFLPNDQVKANNTSEENIPVLKLNSTKKFITGIYPYSIMSSTFSPTTTQNHAIKVSNSVQEWCGQAYMQLNNRDEYEIVLHTYFEGLADQNSTLPKTWLENELWNLIRINPKELPDGELSLIPSFEYIRLHHNEIKSYKATASKTKEGSLIAYTISYNEIPRQLTIYYNTTFPFEIERWEETGKSNTLKTTAVKIKRIQTAYWSQNSNKHLVLRDSLGL